MAGIQPEDWKAIGCDFAAVGGDLACALEEFRAKLSASQVEPSPEIQQTLNGLDYFALCGDEPARRSWLTRARSWFERARPWWVWP